MPGIDKQISLSLQNRTASIYLKREYVNNRYLYRKPHSKDDAVVRDAIHCSCKEKCLQISSFRRVDSSNGRCVTILSCFLV